MKIEKEVVVTEDISKYYGNMNPEMYYDREDIEEFVDQVLAEVVEATGKEDLRLFNIYLSDGDKLKIVLEDRNDVYPVEVKVDPNSRLEKYGIFNYLNDTIDGLVDRIIEHRELFGESLVLKINESINFNEWADQITYNEYTTISKLRKFGKEHPEHRRDIIRLKDKIRDIYDNAYLESVIKEDLVPDNSQSAIDAVIENYGITTKPYKGPSFILPNGSYLNISNVTNHADVEYWLDQQGLSIKADYNRRSGSPTLRSLGCIRVDTPKYYIQLPQDNITSAQYDTLKDWIDFAFTECRVPFIEVVAEGTSPVRYRYEDGVDSDYIVDRIRRYYITDHLYETHEDRAEGPYLKEASYGGAFDIRDDQYFTRDDLDELIDYIETELGGMLVGDKVQVTDADMSNNVLHLEVTTGTDGFWEEFNEKIDMRRIRTPKDLVRVYGKKAVDHFKNQLEGDGIEFSMSECITESLSDVVQTAPYVIVPVGLFGQYKYVTPDGEIILTTDVSESGEVSVSGIEDKKDYFKDTYEAMREFESDLGKYLESEDKE